MAGLTIGGVPEHVNTPWYLAMERGIFDDLDIDVTWQDCPGGTGQMFSGLEDGTLDVALVLTEGAVANIARGGSARIAGTYVSTPLIWGVHVRADTPLVNIEQLRGARYGISRMGSGSHLMAFVDAALRGWPTEDRPTLVKVGGMTGALEAFEAGEIDGFMWEKFMTKPYVDDGVLRRIDICAAPWPAFVFAASPKAIEDHADDLNTIIERVDAICQELSADNGRVIDEVCRFFKELRREDVAEWFSQTRWFCRAEVGEGDLREASRHLVGVGVLGEGPNPQDLLAPGCAMRPALPEVMYEWRVRSLENALEAAGKLEGPLTVDDMGHMGSLDQFHYYGTQACDKAIRLLGLARGSRILDAGSGLGGPARYMAHKTDCNLTCVEIQPRFNTLARQLTERVGLEDKIEFLTGDITTVKLRTMAYDHFVSFLVFLHLVERRFTFANCFGALRPGGTFLIEDIVARTPLTADNQKLLRSVVAAPNLISAARYRSELEEVGFVDVAFEDCTDAWTRWTHERFERFEAHRGKHVELHGEEVTRDRERFYRTVSRLFDQGILGGMRITGRRRGALEERLLAARKAPVRELDFESLAILEFDY